MVAPKATTVAAARGERTHESHDESRRASSARPTARPNETRAIAVT